MNTLEVPPRAANGVGDMAVTPHELATQAALDVMGAGGNAVDGAVAANAVLGVVAPETCGPGGDLFALVHRPGEAAPWALNASGRAGAGASAAALRTEGHAAVPLLGPDSVTVPGCVDGWSALSAELGAVPLATALQPAIRAAAGFPASPELCRALAHRRQALATEPSAAALYPGGAPPAPGTVLRRPDLAATLAAVARDGRDGLYAGPAGAGIVAATGGRVTAADLARDQAEWVEPLGGPAFGLTAWTIPPNSQGWLVLAAAWLFERLGPTADAGDAAYLHAQVEAYRAVAWERDDLVADPASAPLPPHELIAPARLAPRAAVLTDGGVASWPAPAPAPGGTAYLCTIDRSGMGVSLIQSNFHGIGSGLGAGSSGVLLHNRGAGFCLEIGHPNELAPGKRPLHTLSPTLWTHAGRLELLLGTRGGHQQPQLLLQAACHLLAAGDAPAVAQARPRWTMDEFGAGAPSRVLVEERMPAAVADGLTARGHQVETADAWMPGWGPISLIAVDAAGVRTGAADPRISTASAGAR